MPLTSRCINISFNTALAVLLWIVGIGLAIGDWRDWFREGAGLVGIAAVAGGHLLCMHGLFDRQADRELEAFNLGRASVRPIR